MNRLLRSLQGGRTSNDAADINTGVFIVVVVVVVDLSSMTVSFLRSLYDTVIEPKEQIRFLCSEPSLPRDVRYVTGVDEIVQTIDRGRRRRQLARRLLPSRRRAKTLYQ